MLPYISIVPRIVTTCSAYYIPIRPIYVLFRIPSDKTCGAYSNINSSSAQINATIEKWYDRGEVCMPRVQAPHDEFISEG